MSETNEMNQENSAALAGPVSMTISGQTFFLSPLTPGDFGRLREYIRELCLSDVRSPLLALNETFKQLDPAMQAIMAREAMAQAAGAKTAEPTAMAMQEKLTGIDGIRFMFWLSAKKMRPDLTREQVAEIVSDDIRYEVMDKLTQTETQENGDPKAS